MGYFSGNCGGRVDNVYKLTLKISFLFVTIFFSQSAFAVTFSSALSSCQNSSWWGNTNYINKYCTTLTDTKLVKLMGYGKTNGVLYTMQTWGYSGAECDVGELNLSTNICEVTCSDGSKAPTLDQCPTSVTCPDGSTAPTLAQCPPPVNCPDGSTAPTLAQCPKVCPEGQDLDIDNECVAKCVYPEVRNAFGICGIPECPSGQVYDYLLKACVVPPVCVATEIYDKYSNQCKSKKLNCPLHSHPSTANDQCLPDPPMGCPPGQHDDGTYHCVANDAKGCGSNEVHGYIFGIPQCIKKRNTDEKQKEKDDAYAYKQAADSNASATQQAVNDSQAALDADLTNPEKQAQHAANVNANNAAQSQAAKAAETAAGAKGELDSEALKSIADSAKSIDDRQREADEVGFGEVPEPEAVDTKTVSVSQSDHTVTGTCPADVAVNTSRGIFNISFQPVCSFADLISPIVISLAWLAAGFIVFGYKSES